MCAVGRAVTQTSGPAFRFCGSLCGEKGPGKKSKPGGGALHPHMFESQRKQSAALPRPKAANRTNNGHVVVYLAQCRNRFSYHISFDYFKILPLLNNKSLGIFSTKLF